MGPPTASADATVLAGSAASYPAVGGRRTTPQVTYFLPCSIGGALRPAAAKLSLGLAGLLNRHCPLPTFRVAPGRSSLQQVTLRGRC